MGSSSMTPLTSQPIVNDSATSIRSERGAASHGDHFDYYRFSFLHISAFFLTGTNYITSEDPRENASYLDHILA